MLFWRHIRYLRTVICTLRNTFSYSLKKMKYFCILSVNITQSSSDEDFKPYYPLKHHYLFRYLTMIAVILVLGLSFSCSTKKNTFSRRTYHNITTHYNVYWNGNESFKNGKKSLEENVVDNYNIILPVYNFGSAEDARKIYSTMDRAIEKAGIAIPKHSMFFKNKEYNKWIDDCYMLIAKAQFFKQDYPASRKTLEYIMKQYVGKNIQLEASLWFIRSFIQQKRYEDATAQLEAIEAQILKNKTPFYIKKQIPLVYAQYYLETNNLNAAKTYLKQGIDLNTNKLVKARLNFILGQIAQREKDYAAATDYYSKVVKSPASFDMVFNARINMARSFDINTGDKAGLEKQLKRMLRDTKNKEYYDQIYFALSELAQLDRNDTLVMHYLKLSVASSTKNNYQKSSSALLLADRYFKKQDYENAASYYDTTIQTLPKEHPDYEAINNKTTILSELVANLRTVQYEDSLQRLAALPEKELTAIIKKIIDQYEAEERRIKEEEEQQRLEMSMATNIPNMRNENISGVGGGGWYFYNPSAISFGYSEFMRKWGRRKLEDNWRLSNKRVVVQFDDEVSNVVPKPGDTLTIGGPATTKKTSTDPKSPQTYIDQLPTTPEKIAASNKLIANALLNLGYIYKDGLKDIPHSVEKFEDYAKRFPTNKDIIRIYYQLYLIGVETSDEELAEKYKNIILTSYGDTDYAEIIRNPDYNQEVLAKKNRASSLYEETYQAYTRDQYRMVILYSDQAIGQYKDKDLIPRFQYLRAMSLGKTIGTDTMLVALNKLVLTYPTHPIAPVAQDIINKFGKSQPTAIAAAASSTSTPTDNNATSSAASTNSNDPFAAVGDTLIPDIYKANFNTSHFYIMMVNEKFVNVNATKIRISDFISKNFSTLNLSVNAIVIDGGWQMITVSSFRNSQAAMDFYKAISASDYIMAQLGKQDFKQMVISMENYPVFYREKKYDGYLNFFRANYLK